MKKDIVMQVFNKLYYQKYLMYTKNFCNNSGINYDSLSITRKAVLIDLIYNLGGESLKSHEKFINNLKSCNYYDAAKELIDSNYAC